MKRGARSDAGGVQPPADVRLLETDLRDWAGGIVAEAGRREALLGRVEQLRLASDGRSLAAAVRGPRAVPYRVEVGLEQGRVTSRCTCGDRGTSHCRHAVAALEVLRFPPSQIPAAGASRASSGRARGRGKVIRKPSVGDGYLVMGDGERTPPREERIALAREEEIALRRSRASRRRARVERLAGPGPQAFRVTSRRDGEARTVRLRGDSQRPSCTCRDFAENELGTCSHIERLRRSRVRRSQASPAPWLSAWWSPRPWLAEVPEPLREIRFELPDPVSAEQLAPFRDGEGWLAAPPAGRSPVEWARAALERARDVARACGVGWDLDAAVQRHVAAAAEREARQRCLARIGREHPEWRRITEGLSFRLHAYQERGALFLARRGRAFLADDMGLGKTVQAIVAALLLRRADGARKALVVCPASLKHQWRQEIALACGEQATVIEGTPARRREAYARWTDGFAVLNYELVLRDLAEIRGTRPDLVVLDEAQRIKNWDTKTAQAVKRLPSRHAFVLTGTPLENRLLELHSLVEFLHPRALGPRWRLLPTHAVTESLGRVVAYEGLDLLRRRLAEFFLRRDRATVLDQLPDRTDNTFWTWLGPLQQRAYRRQAATAASLLSRGQPLGAGEIRLLLQSLTRMRMLCNGYAQFAWNDFEERLGQPEPPGRAEIKALGAPKLEEFARVLEEVLDESDEKIVVFSQWERALRLARFVVREALELRELRSEVFHGGLASRARGALLEDFRTDPTFRVLFSTDAGGLGLNLQRSASVVFNLEVPWNPAVLEQRVGRVHRMGQRRSVRVLHFVTRGAIEERVRRVVADKRALFDGLLVDGLDRVDFDEESRGSLLRRLSSLLP